MSTDITQKQLSHRRETRNKQTVDFGHRSLFLTWRCLLAGNHEVIVYVLQVKATWKKKKSIDDNEKCFSAASVTACRNMDLPGCKSCVKQTNSLCSCSLSHQSEDKHYKKKKLIGWKGNVKMETKAVSPPTLPPAEFDGFDFVRFHGPWSWFHADYRCQGKFVAFTRATVTHTPAERPSIQQLLQHHENTFFSLLVEERKVKKTSRRWNIYCKASFRWKRWTCCTKSKLLDFFNVLAPAKSCRRGFGKWWASPWGEDQHEGEAPQYFKARRLWFRRRKWNLFSFPFTSHSRSSCCYYCINVALELLLDFNLFILRD